MPNRGPAPERPGSQSGDRLPGTSARDLQPRGPGWQLDHAGNGAGRGMVIQGGQLPGQNPAYRPSAHLFFRWGVSARCRAAASAGEWGFHTPATIGRANGTAPVGLFAQGMRRWAGRGRRSGALATGGGGMRQSWHSQGGLTCPGSTARCGSMPPHGQEPGWGRQVPMFSSATRSCPCGDQE